MSLRRILVLSLFFISGVLPSFADDSNALPQDAVQALAAIGNSTLYRIDPQPPQSDAYAAHKDFGLIDEISLDVKTSRKAAALIKEAVAGGQPGPLDTFTPRHMLRVPFDGHNYDFLVAYDSRGLKVYRDDLLIGSVGINGIPDGLDALLKGAHIYQPNGPDSTSTSKIPNEALVALDTTLPSVLCIVDPLRPPGQGEDSAHGPYSIVNHVRLDLYSKRLAVQAIKDAVNHFNGSISLEFLPDHMFRTQYRGHTFDFVMSFSTGTMDIYRDNRKIANLGITGDTKIFDNIVTSNAPPPDTTPDIAQTPGPDPNSLPGRPVLDPEQTAAYKSITNIDQASDNPSSPDQPNDGSAPVDESQLMKKWQEWQQAHR